MKKIETIWHHVLWSALKNKQYKFTQQELAREFCYSLSTINLAVSVPSQIGAIKKTSKFFLLSDFKKLLYLYASVRNLQKDIIYKTFVDMPVSQIEGFVPSQCIFACYSAAKDILKEPPADYSKIYVYCNEKDLPRIAKRFGSPNSKNPNFYVLKGNESLKRYGNVTSLPQTFVDIWNLSDWYSRDFTASLEEKINGILS